MLLQYRKLLKVLLQADSECLDELCLTAADDRFVTPIWDSVKKLEVFNKVLHSNKTTVPDVRGLPDAFIASFTNTS